MRPDWCPESVWVSARIIVCFGYDDPTLQQLTREDVARAILKERERCANIARNWPDRIEGRGIAERIMDDAR